MTLLFMKRMPATSKLRIASVIVVGLVLLVMWSLRSKPAGKDWLSVSQPVFGSRTNAKGIIPTVSFYPFKLKPAKPGLLGVLA